MKKKSTKKYSTIVLCVTILLTFNSTCMANPLSRIISFFQRDLVINVLYKNHRNLIQGSEVYLANDPKVPKVVIGKVNKVSLLESKLSKVEISIDKKYKNQIYKTTPFVLMSSFFSSQSDTYIVAVSSDTLEKTPLESGVSVEGISFLEYKIITAGKRFKTTMDSLINQNEKIVEQLQGYLDNFNMELFQKKIDSLIDQISQFSTDQKETFRKDVLPELRNMFDSIIKQFEEQNDKEKSKNMEKRLQKIEDLVDV